MARDIKREANLLQAVLDNPSDPVHRFVLADWCEEHGDDAAAGFWRSQAGAAAATIASATVTVNRSIKILVPAFDRAGRALAAAVSEMVNVIQGAFRG